MLLAQHNFFVQLGQYIEARIIRIEFLKRVPLKGSFEEFYKGIV